MTASTNEAGEKKQSNHLSDTHTTVKQTKIIHVSSLSEYTSVRTSINTVSVICFYSDSLGHLQRDMLFNKSKRLNN